MSKIRAQINSFTSNEIICKKFINFYQCAKTISLLNSLRTSQVIQKSVYTQQMQNIRQVYLMLEKDLKNYDLQRFCQLWQIEYHKNLQQPKKKSQDVPLYIVRIANILPQMNDTIYSAQTYGQIYQAFANFCQLIQNMKSSPIPSSMQTVIEQLTNIDKKMIQFKFGDQINPEVKDSIKQLLTKFRVEFQRIYQL